MLSGELGFDVCDGIGWLDALDCERERRLCRLDGQVEGSRGFGFRGRGRGRGGLRWWWGHLDLTGDSGRRQIVILNDAPQQQPTHGKEWDTLRNVLQGRLVVVGEGEGDVTKDDGLGLEESELFTKVGHAYIP